MKETITLKVIGYIVRVNSSSSTRLRLGGQEEAVLGPAPINFNDSRFRRVVVTHVTSDLKLYVQYSEQGPKVEQLQSELRDIFSQTKPVGGHVVKKGELLAARYTADNEWYRARVEKIENNNRVSVYFIDYGNREVISDSSRFTTLPPGMYLSQDKLAKKSIVSCRLFTITSTSS